MRIRQRLIVLIVSLGAQGVQGTPGVQTSPCEGRLRPDFGKKLIAATEPIQNFELALALYHFIDLGLYEELKKKPSSLERLSSLLKLSKERLRALIEFLVTAGVLGGSSNNPYLTDQWREHLAISWGHYKMRVGGYVSTLSQLGDVVRGKLRYATRDTSNVADGSCQMSRFNAFPLIRRLLARVPKFNATVMDVGCGTGTALAEILEDDPSLKGIGIDQDAGAINIGQRMIRDRKLSERLTLIQAGASDPRPKIEAPGAIIASFLLHEILEQQGESGVIQFVEQLMANYPLAHFIFIEVDGQVPAEVLRQYDFGRAYYNGYQLNHALTEQRLMPRSYWIKLFDRLGLEILWHEAVNPNVDSAQLEFGLLLRPKKREGFSAPWSPSRNSEEELSMLSQRLRFASQYPERRWINLVENVPQRRSPPSLTMGDTSGLAQDYGDSGGSKELIEEIIQREIRVSGVSYTSNQVLVTNGSLHALNLIFQKHIMAGDKVVVQAPSYSGIALSLKKRSPEILAWSLEDLEVDSNADFANLMKLNAKMIYINSPNNPTGELISAQLLRRLQGFAVQTGAILVVDLVYDELFEVPLPTLASSQLKNTYLVNSVSKNYGRPGLRIGWILSSSDHVEEMTAFLEKQVVSVSPVTQHHARIALRERNQILKDRIRLNRSRLIWELPRIFGALLGKQVSYELSPSSAQFMLHLGVPDIEDFANRMFQKHGVILVTNSHYFGLESPSVRIPLGRDMNESLLGLELIALEVAESIRDRGIGN